MPFPICSHGEEEVWLLAYTTYGQGILKQLIHVARASTMRGGKDDGTASLRQIIYAFIDDIISQASITVCPEPLLVIPDPVEIALLNAGPSINSILLKESVCMKDVGWLNFRWTNVEAIGIIQQLCDLFGASSTILIYLKRDIKMPALLTTWKEKDIVKSGIERAEMADAPELTTLESQYNVTVVRDILRTISRNDSSNLIGRRKIISSTISSLLEVNADKDMGLLLWRLLSHDLICLLVELSKGMMSPQYIMYSSEEGRVQIWISDSTNISGFLGIIDIELCIGSLLTFWRHETTHVMMKSTMDFKSMWARVLKSTIINCNSNRGERCSTVVLADVVDKLGDGIQLVKLNWPLLLRWKADLALQATCTKARISLGGIRELF